MNIRMSRSTIARPIAGGRRGFTLVEVIVAVAVIGLGVGAILISSASGSRTNNYGQKLTQATFLAQEMREMTLRMPFVDPDPNDAVNDPGPDGSDPTTFVDDLDDLLNSDGNGTTYSPPVRAERLDPSGNNYVGSRINDMTGWSQHITLSWRSQNDLDTVVANGGSDVVFAEVTIYYKSEEMLQTGWLITRK